MLKGKAIPRQGPTRTATEAVTTTVGSPATAMMDDWREFVLQLAAELPPVRHRDDRHRRREVSRLREVVARRPDLWVRCHP